jgi:voltage-gated potassium channel
LVAAVPFHLIFGVFPLVFLRLVKLVRVAHWMSQWRHIHIQRWNILRLVYFVCWLALFVHWLATGWLALRGLSHAGDPWTAYLHSLYWCISTLTTIGYTDFTPVNKSEYLYAIAVMIFGVGMYGYVIANVSTILTNLEPGRARYMANLERVGAFMQYRRIPSGLRKRIREYYAYLWEERLGYDEGPIVDALPPGLRTEVSLHLKRDIIQKVPFFQKARESLLRDIALQMRPVVYTPGDYVFRKGDPGKEMYFISSGRLQVLSEDGNNGLATLGEGDFFGEMALLLDQPRTASVRAEGYCDLYRLEKSDFLTAMAKHPDFAEHVRTMTEVRRKRKRL